MSRVRTMTGNLKQVSVGSKDHVWGIDSHGRIWRFTGDDQASWPFARIAWDELSFTAVRLVQERKS